MNVNLNVTFDMDVVRTVFEHRDDSMSE